MRFIIITFFLSLVFILPAYAKLHDPLLVQDDNTENHLPLKFRTSSDIILDPAINTLGLAELHIAGSAQFQDANLKPILAKLKTDHMTVVDLRNESHGFLNNEAISWYGKHNATNAGKSLAVVNRLERKLLNKLMGKKQVKVYKILVKTKSGIIKKASPTKFIVKDVATEAQIVANQNLDYQRFYVEDFHAPNQLEVERFVQFVKNLPAHEWLYFHCRGGSGRTTTFMVMYDMLRNAKIVSFNEILARQKALGGKDLKALPKPGTYKYKYAVARLNFLKNFYLYAQQV